MVEYRNLAGASVVLLAKVLSCDTTSRYLLATLGQVATAQLHALRSDAATRQGIHGRLVRHENRIPEERDEEQWRASFVNVMSHEGASQLHSEAWEPSEGHTFLLLLATPRELPRGEPEQGGQGAGLEDDLRVDSEPGGKWQVGEIWQLYRDGSQHGAAITGHKWR